MIVYLKSFVINGVSFSVYVNVAHFCLVWCFFSLCWWDGVGFPGEYRKWVVVYY